jgi:hypothetical protein
MQVAFFANRESVEPPSDADTYAGAPHKSDKNCRNNKYLGAALLIYAGEAFRNKNNEIR